MNFLLNALGLLVVVIVCILVVTFLAMGIAFIKLNYFFAELGKTINDSYKKVNEKTGDHSDDK